MKAGLSVALAVACALGGCAADGGAPQNPNLLAPKLVVQPRGDANVTVFVHGAFREQVYDWIRVSIDNETLGNRTFAFSFEANVPREGFFLDAEAGVADQVYFTRARLDLDAEEDRILVALVDDEGTWREPREFSIPYEHIFDRPQVSH